ncbi:MAG: AMP-binding protein [Alphaproteobacteria bacterium]
MEESLQGPTVGELVLRSIRRYGSREALVDGDRRLTYAQMGARVSQLVQAMRAGGVTRGAGLCQLTANSIDALLIRTAAQLLGARLAVLNPLSGAEEHAFIARDSESTFLISDPAFAGSVTHMVEASSLLQQVWATGTCAFGENLNSLADAYTPQPLVDESRAGDITQLVYTGGTTGIPKGVVHKHRATVASTIHMCAEFEWPVAPRFLVVTALSHAGGGLVLPVWVQGGTVILQAGFDPAGFLACIERERVSAAWLVPTMIYRLLDYPGLKDADVSSLRLMIYGGSPIQPSVLEAALDRFGPVFLQLYAQREASMPLTTLNTWDHDLSQPERLASCGYPSSGLQVSLLDDGDQPVAAGEVGEICVRGPVVMEGYWNRPEETERALRNGWLHTDDMGRQDQAGFIYIVDRKKDMIISGGFNVYPKEVEDVLTRHPGVAQAAVIGVPDEKWGEKVLAVVVCNGGAQVRADELIALVKDSKGSVLAPKAVDFVDAIPVTSVGKPDKKALRARYWADEDRQVH